MEVKIQHLGGVKFSAETRGHCLISDQPATNGGEDSGMTPPELLLASLGTCAAYYVAEYLRRHSLECPGLELTVSGAKAKPPARVAAFHIDVIAPGISREHENGLQRSVHSCVIHNTLLNLPSIETRVHCGVEAEGRYNPV